VAFFADLDEKKAAAKVIDDFLPAAAMPPFDSVIVLPAGHDDPVRAGLPQGRLDQTQTLLFFRAEVDIALKCCRTDTQAKLVVEELDKPVNEMVWQIVAPVNQWIMADHGTYFWIAFVQRRQMRIVLPQGRAGRAHIREESSGIGTMQVPDGGREHDNVARRKPVFKDPLFHDPIERC